MLKMELIRDKVPDGQWRRFGRRGYEAKVQRKTRRSKTEKPWLQGIKKGRREEEHKRGPI